MMSGRALLFVLALPLAGCVTAPAPSSEDCGANAHCAARAAEPPLFGPGHAERQGNRLILATTQGKPANFRDNAEACGKGDVQHCVMFALTGVFPKSHAWVVEKFYYEGSDFLLVDDRSARQTKLNGMPVFSGDGGEFLVAPFDDEADVGPNNIEIWRRDGDSAVLEWAHPFRQAYAEDPALPSLYTVRVTRWRGDRIDLALATERPVVGHWTGALTRNGGAWRLAAKSPPGLFALRTR